MATALGAIVGNPVVMAAAMEAISFAIKTVEKQAQGEITVEQALEALKGSSQAVQDAFANWHAAANAPPPV